MLAGKGKLTTQIGLQISHQKRGSDSLPGDVADKQSEPFFRKSKEIVVVGPDMAPWIQTPA
jgi:hypothetical protein